ncbi:MAG: hypothetical protein WA799_03430 [Nitrosotalea sp.]
MWDGNNEYLVEKNSQTKPYMAHVKWLGNFTFQSNTTVTTMNRTVYTHQGITVITTNTKNYIMNGFFIANSTFQSPEVFSVDNNINYTIFVPIDSKMNIKEFYFVLDTTVDNFHSYKDNVPMLLYLSQLAGTLIPLHKENPNLFSIRNANWTDPQQNDQVSLYAVVINENNQASVSDLSPVLFTVAPHLDKLQADTDLDIQKQNLQSIKSNNNVEVLTWLIIALIPIGFMIELIIHGYLIKDDFDRTRFHDG